MRIIVIHVGNNATPRARSRGAFSIGSLRWSISGRVTRPHEARIVKALLFMIMKGSQAHGMRRATFPSCLPLRRREKILLEVLPRGSLARN